MRCDKTGLTDKDWRTILDVVNVFDPGDIAHVYPEMGSPEFMQDVKSAFKAVLAHVERQNIQKSHGGQLVPQYGPGGADSTKPETADVPFTGEAIDPILLANQQWLHDS